MNKVKIVLLVVACVLLTYVLVHALLSEVFATSDALAIIGLLLAVYLGLPKKRPKDSIELSKLIKTFLIPVKAKHTILPWYTGAQKESPINWTSAYEKDNQTSLVDDYSISRKGLVKGLIKGKISHYILREKNEPCEWTILLGGANVGIAKVEIHSTINSHELDPEKVFNYLKTKLDLIFEEDYMDGIIGSGEKLYKINSKKYQPKTLRLAYSCGSAGCGIFITIE